MELQITYYFWLNGLQFYLCPDLRCSCHHGKQRRFYRNTKCGVIFDSINGCWAFVGSLPTSNTHAATNGITMRELGTPDHLLKTSWDLEKYPYQQFCQFKVEGKICAKPTIKWEKPRKDSKWLCAEHYKEHRLDQSRERSRKRLAAIVKKPCLCGCGKLTRGEYALGHHMRTETNRQRMKELHTITR